MGEGGVLLLSVAAVFSIGANALNFYVAGPRVIFGMADRGLLPAPLTRVTGHAASPANAILLFTGMVALMLTSGAFEFLVTVTSAGAQCVTLGYIAAFIVLMRRPHGDHNGLLRMYWWPVIAVAGCFAAFSVAQAQVDVFLLLGVLLALGTGLYFVARRGKVSTPQPIFD